MTVIAYQGWPGANSHLACRLVYPDDPSLPCASFEDTLGAVHEGRADLAMIPVENTLAGRVADIHHLLPESGLHIIGEHFQRVHHHLLGLPGARIETLREVHSHVHALGQCRRFLRRIGAKAVVHADTAGAAEMVAQRGDPTIASISSALAAELNGLAILQPDVEDEAHNTTRFLVMAPQPQIPPEGSGPTITSFLFEVRSVPAALYKAMGGFATNGVNITKLESYMVGGRFAQAQFFADVEGHPEERGLRNALEELRFFSRRFRLLGTYPAHPFRRDRSQATDDEEA